jgi:hypothetical protein
MKQNTINKLIIISVLAIVFVMAMCKSSVYEGAVTMSLKRMSNDSPHNYMDNKQYLKSGDRINSQDKSHYVRFIKHGLYVYKYITDSDGEYVLKTNGKKQVARVWAYTMPREVKVIYIGGSGTLLMSKGTNEKALLTSGEHKSAVKLKLNNDGSLDLVSEQDKSVWSMGKDDMKGKLVEAMAGIEGLTVSTLIQDRIDYQDHINNAVHNNEKQNRLVWLEASEDLSERSNAADVFFNAEVTSDGEYTKLTDNTADLEDSELAGIVPGDDYGSCKGITGHDLILCNDRKMRRQRQILDNKVTELNQMGDSHITEKGMQLDSTIYASLAWTVLASSLVFYAFTS